MADANLTVSTDSDLTEVIKVLENGACSPAEALELLVRATPKTVIERFANSQASKVRQMAVLTACRLLEAGPGDKYSAGVAEMWQARSPELHERTLSEAERNLVLLADLLAQRFAKPWH